MSERLGGDGGIDNPDIRPADERMFHDVEGLPADERMFHDVEGLPADERMFHDVEGLPADERMVHDVEGLPADERMVHDVEGLDMTPAAQPMGGGLPLIPIAIGIGVVVVAIAAFSFLGGGGAPAGSPGATLAPGSTPGASAPAASAPAATQGGGGPAAEETANLVLTGPDVAGSWTLDGNSGDVSPTAELIAAVWTETTSNVAEGYGELVTLTLGGPIVEGTQSTSVEGLSLGISISRFDAAGNSLFDHIFSSRGGECQVTMTRTATGVSGSFTCTGIADGDGHTSTATGSFAT